MMNLFLILIQKEKYPMQLIEFIFSPIPKFPSCIRWMKNGENKSKTHRSRSEFNKQSNILRKKFGNSEIDPRKLQERKQNVRFVYYNEPKNNQNSLEDSFIIKNACIVEE